MIDCPCAVVRCLIQCALVTVTEHSCVVRFLSLSALVTATSDIPSAVCSSGMIFLVGADFLIEFWKKI